MTISLSGELAAGFIASPFNHAPVFEYVPFFEHSCSIIAMDGVSSRICIEGKTITLAISTFSLAAPHRYVLVKLNDILAKNIFDA